MMIARKPNWDSTLRLHAEAADAFAGTAESLSEGSWRTPIAEGKWTPAEITAHLILAYEVLRGELESGRAMAVRTRRWQRWLLRIVLVPRLLKGGRFPVGARAPRETRPPSDVPQDRDALLARFRGEADRFSAAVVEARRQNPRRRLTHAYFGAASLRDGILLCARHVQHHQRQIAERIEHGAPVG